MSDPAAGATEDAPDSVVPATFFYQRARRLHRLALAALVFVPLGLHWAGTAFLPALTSIVFTLVGALVLAGATTTRGGGVSVSARGIRMGKQFVPRSRIDAVYIVPAGTRRPLRVVVIADGGKVHAWFDATESSAERALGELALGGARIRGRRILRMTRDSVHGLALLAFAGVVAFAVAWWIPLVLGALVWSLQARLRGTEVTVAPDGLGFRAYNEHAFVVWNDIVELEPLPRGFYVRTKDGQVRTFYTVPNRLTAAEPDREELASFLARARELRAAADHDGDVTAIVAAALAAEGPFRDASVRREDLWRVVESGGATAELRLKAAKLLASEATTEERARLRVVAEWCAEPKVRVELEALAPSVDEDSGSVEGLDEREVHARR